MGVKDSFLGASTLNKVALVLTFVANLFSWIAFTTTSWMQSDGAGVTTHIGLWRTCTDVQFASCNMLDGQGDGPFSAVQAFAIFGFVALNAACLLLMLAIFWDSCKGNSEVTMASAILLFVAGTCWLIAIIIFGAEYDRNDYEDQGYDLHFSFALAIISAIVAIVAGVLVIMTRGSSGVSSS